MLLTKYDLFHIHKTWLVDPNFISGEVSGLVIRSWLVKMRLSKLFILLLVLLILCSIFADAKKKKKNKNKGKKKDGKKGLDKHIINGKFSVTLNKIM